MSKNKCATCRFWWSWDFIGKNGSGKGECRRYPPTVVMLPKSVGGDTDRATPVTGQGYWCGEWQNAPERAPHPIEKIEGGGK